MKGSLRQRSPGSWEITVDLGRDPLGRRRRRFATVRGTKAHAQRRFRELLSTLDRGVGLPDGRLSIPLIATTRAGIVNPSRPKTDAGMAHTPQESRH